MIPAQLQLRKSNTIFFQLVSVRNELGKNFEDIAEAIDRTASAIAEQIQPWIPEAVRAPMPADAALFRPFKASPPPPKGLVERVQDWVLRNRALAAAIIAFAGTSGVLYLSRKTLLQKRRKARKAANGCRKEIIVIAGSPHEPMTRSIANDLERRGFIVYVTVMSGDEERLVRAEGRADILPLWIDITSVRCNMLSQNFLLTRARSPHRILIFIHLCTLFTI